METLKLILKLDFLEIKVNEKLIEPVSLVKLLISFKILRCSLRRRIRYLHELRFLLSLVN